MARVKFTSADNCTRRPRSPRPAPPPCRARARGGTPDRRPRASPVSAKAWQRQPPKSCSRRGQLAHGSFIQAVPRKALKAGEFVPDVGERMLAHVPEFEPGNGFGGVARQHLAGRRHVERAPPPAADARLGKARVIIRHHRVDDDAAVMPLAQRPRPAPRRARPARGSASARRDCSAPSRNIAHARSRRGSRPSSSASIHHVPDALDVAAMHHGIDRERQVEPHDLRGRGALSARTRRRSRRYGRRTPRWRPGSRSARGRGRPAASAASLPW